ncbi:MAG: tetratricopeptide repeat protein [Spirochaetaceae bacterium]|jgi:Tfp pilus assembly protein PilF|nr:tetratricopeptide repeat protein [Spirochaetaceae bacterium]
MDRTKNSLPVLLFSLSLCAILAQTHLFAAELSDAGVFAGALCIAFFAARGQARLNVRIVPFLLTAALSPFAARLFIMLPRVFIMPPQGSIDGGLVSATMIALDSLLLNFDRNLFVFLFPYYWMTAAVYFSSRFPSFLPAAIAASDFLFIAIFLTGKSDTVALYAKPLTLIMLIAVIVFFEAAALIVSIKKKYTALASEKIQAAVFALVLIVAGGILALRPAEESAIGKGGGLLEPKLFSFDFAPFLRLENEISMNESLVFIMRKEEPDKEPGNDDHFLLRRYVLSGFDTKTGWTRNTGVDEEAHPNKLPNRSITYKKDGRKSRGELKSDYFLVNIDAGAFIAAAEPVSVTPYYTNSNTSYKASYSVVSSVSNALPYELLGATDAGNAETGFSALDVDYYTKWEGDRRVKMLAEALTAGIENYWEKVQTIYLYLKYGDYRYSLKPGAAVDGDQLGQFLFGNKKGYCSYFAFAYASLLRSIHIPARIAVGFFINPDEERIGFYPVRANMAHAWVEVFFPEFGWIEFDPTTQQLAEGENFSFGEGLPPDFERLIKEILETERIPREGADEDQTENPANAAAKFTQNIVRFIAGIRYIILAFIFFVLVINYIAGYYIRSKLTKNKRKKAIYLYRFALRLLSFKGKAYKKKTGETEAAFAQSLEQSIEKGENRNTGFYQLYQMTERARFAQEWTHDDEENFLAAYRFFMEKYRTLKRRKKPSALHKTLFLLMAFTAVSAGPEEYDREEHEIGETLLREAASAEMSENWEKAVELYTEGKTLFPEDSRFPYYLGLLYHHQALYNLAFDEFRKAETIAEADDFQLLYSLAETAGPLNLYAESARYYEKILELIPDDTDAIANLGWLYFKLHRLADGARLLENALKSTVNEEFGDSLRFLTTLAIIYSDMYRYDESAELYKKSIAITESTGRKSSASLAHYNYSILESRFYNHERAFTETEESLFWEKRYSGYLARGEMYLDRFDFNAAANDYERALESDPTTLSKISLALVYQTRGKLDEALLLAHEALDSRNLSWMLNFGINEDQYKRDIYEILYKTSKGLYHRNKNTVYTGMKEKAANSMNTVKHYFNGIIYKHLYEKYTLKFAKGFNLVNSASGGQFPLLPEYLEALAQYVNCFEKYPRRALSYLTASKNIETALIPKSAPSYMRTEGDMKNDTALLQTALSELDPVWEMAEIAEAYQNIHRLYRKTGEAAKAEDAAEKLYLVNRGALLQNGVPLPVTLEFDFGGMRINAKAQKRIAAALAAMLKKSGFATSLRKQAAFTLVVNADASSPAAEIYETSSGKSIVRKAFTQGDFSRNGLARLARDIAAMAFTME